MISDTESIEQYVNRWKMLRLLLAENQLSIGKSFVSFSRCCFPTLLKHIDQPTKARYNSDSYVQLILAHVGMRLKLPSIQGESVKFQFAAHMSVDITQAKLLPISC